MIRDLKKILKLMEQKYPQSDFGLVAVLIYDDEAGRIINHATEPYDHAALLEFGSIKELVKHLQEK